METLRLIPALVNDIVGEIFHHFVAVDWEGPFLLILVSKGWRDLVLSRPSLWTWIKLDDTQIDWREKVLIGQALSQGLPLRAVVRVPFDHFDELTNLLPRFESITLDTSTHTQLYAGEPGPVGQVTFAMREEYYQDVYEGAARMLSVLSDIHFPIYVESVDSACFAYGTWSIYERVRKTRTLKDQFQDISPHLITRLVFRNKDDSNPRRVKISSIWPYLPSILFLQDLEISDNFMGVDKVSDIADISLVSLEILRIDCPTRWLAKPSAKNGPRVDLLGLLEHLQAPILSVMRLSSPHNAIFNALTHAQKFHVHTLELSAELLGPTPEVLPDQLPTWHWLTHFIINLSKWYDPASLSSTLALLVPLAPPGCLMRLSGADAMMSHIMGFNHPIDAVKYSKQGPMGVEACEFQYQMPLVHSYRGGHSLVENEDTKLLQNGETIFAIDEDTRLADFLGMIRPHSGEYEAPTREQIVACITFDGLPDPLWAKNLWRYSPQHLVYTNKFALPYPSGFLVRDFANSIVLQSLDIGHFVHSSAVIGHPPRKMRLLALKSLRCVANQFYDLSVMWSMPQLVDLALTGPGFLPESWFSEHLLQQAGSFPRLAILRFEEFQSPWIWSFQFISAFNRSGLPGITRVELPGHLHPSLLRILVQALRGELTKSEPDQLVDSGVNMRSYNCHFCSLSGWTCFDAFTCARSSAGQKVTITRYTSVMESD
ncbi:hypothetical protein M408DRAFT_28161 [Serendipita vermifera MAFF 305830]|uniref:Uncharacterized protein n=1 Tax=Serendipita vermifera MAFF 305830 TaxID=933852 RepID=A0A0C3AVA0_SERVB|nr:hypothetical protein M408DRAFT_28161 [Serendipita vermifera MAFF 305830]